MSRILKPMTRKDICDECKKKVPQKYMTVFKRVLFVCKSCAEQLQVEEFFNKKELSIAKTMERNDIGRAINILKNVKRYSAKKFKFRQRMWLERKILEWKSMLYEKKGNYLKSIHYLKLRLKRKADSRNSIVITYLYLGNNLEKLGEVDKAIKFLEKGLRIADGNGILAILLNKISEIYEKIEKPIPLKEIYLESLIKSYKFLERYINNLKPFIKNDADQLIKNCKSLYTKVQNKPTDAEEFKKLIKEYFMIEKQINLLVKKIGKNWTKIGSKDQK